MNKTTTSRFCWKPGNKQGISFANLEQLRCYEPDTYNLFNQPIFDGQRVEMTNFNYRIRRTKWGNSVTRFLRSDKDSTQQQPQQEQQPLEPSQPWMAAIVTKTTGETAPNKQIMLQRLREMQQSLARFQQQIYELSTFIEGTKV
jgi:hypothetical protein